MSQTKAQIVDVVGGVGNGTAAAPALTGDDTDTGISFGTNTVTTSVGGAAATTVDSSSRLLVGTTTSIVGKANQQRTFQVAKAQASTSQGVGIYHFDSGGQPPNFELGLSKNNTLGSHTAVSSGDNCGAIIWSGSAGSEFEQLALIAGVCDGTPSGTSMPGRLGFFTTASGSVNPTERMRIARTGSILFGTTSSPASSGIGSGFIPDTNSRSVLFMRTDTTAGRVLCNFGNTNGETGSIQVSGTSTSYVTSSDYRLKENVVDLDGAIDRVKQLAPKRFNFIADAETTVDGFLAHEAQAVVPEAVTGTRDGLKVWEEDEELPDGVSVGDNKLDDDGNTIPVYQGIDQSKLVPLLTAALQEAIGKIETLEATTTSQAATIAALDARLTALEGH